jgi:autotransporter-associated beta strand protein
MNVTQPLVAYYSPASNSNPDNIATMTSYGTYTFESRQNDPFEGLIFFDVIGTPIIQQKVMAVTPAQTYNLVQATLGVLTAQTTLQSTVPSLPSKGLYHVPVTWTNFITGNPVPSEGPNPVVNGVSAKGPNATAVTKNWLFDSGAQFTIISPDYATEMGVNLNNPIQTIEGQGVGGSIVQFDEFQLTEIALPLSNGDRMVFHNPYVWVPEGVSLPADLTGILGENLWMQSADSIDPETGQPQGSHPSLFTQWYLDGPGSELVLYDPNSKFGVIPPVWTGTVNHNWTVLTADVNWTGNPWTNDPDRTQPNSATFNAGATTVTVNGLIDVGTINFNTGGWTLAAGAGLLAYGGTGTLTINNPTGTNTINAVIADGASFGAGGGVTSLAISGPGKLILGGPNTYSGGTTLTAGTLIVSNISGSATGSGNVVLNGGILGGSGTIAGHVLPGTGAHTIHPGEGLAANATATLTVGALTTSTSTTLAFNLVTPGHSSTNDLIHVTSIAGLTLNGGNIQVANTSTGAGSLGYYRIIQYAGALQGTGISSLTLPTVQSNIAYSLDTTRDSGFIDLHRGYLGDTNDDGTVNFADFVQLSNHYGQSNQGWLGADFDNNGTTNFADFVILSNHYGQSITGNGFTATPDELAAMNAFAAANAPVPEPASLSLIALALPLILRRRHKQSP